MMFGQGTVEPGPMEMKTELRGKQGNEGRQEYGGERMQACIQCSVVLNWFNCGAL